MAQRDAYEIPLGRHDRTMAMSQLEREKRSPKRKVVAVERPDKTVVLLTLACGHVRRFRPEFSYQVGDTVRCSECANGRTTYAG